MAGRLWTTADKHEQQETLGVKGTDKSGFRGEKAAAWLTRWLIVFNLIEIKVSSNYLICQLNIPHLLKMIKMANAWLQGSHPPTSNPHPHKYSHLQRMLTCQPLNIGTTFCPQRQTCYDLFQQYLFVDFKLLTFPLTLVFVSNTGTGCIQFVLFTLQPLATSYSYYACYKWI